MQDTVIYAKAKFKARSDTLANWQRINPVLLSGETAVVTDGSETEKIKLGDGVTPFNQLGWFKGPKGDNGENYVLTESDKTEIADMLKPKKVTFVDGATITVEDNTNYYADTDISSLTIIYPNTNFICSFDFTIASEGDITITLPESKYIGGTPSFANGETWEVNIKNGVVVGGLVE